ncbi:MAG TPA: DNA translocase FtsK 4TM domain-containing protein [Candidatus Paceibacterota bacterium]|nr:DNA translocase FtsK 4TM domain-containing protein [Candidatus Paceibacterota bacterium]
MAKKRLQKKKSAGRTVWGLILLLIGLVTLAGMLGGAGAGGSIFAGIANWLFGIGAIIVPATLVTYGILILRRRTLGATRRQWISGSIGILALLGLVSTGTNYHGGIIGRGVASPLLSAFDRLFGTIVLLFITVGALIIFFDRSPNIFTFFATLWRRIAHFFSSFGKRKDNEELEDEEVFTDYQEDEQEPLPAVSGKEKEVVVNDSTAGEFSISEPKRRKHIGDYVPPPLSLLESDRGKANVGDVKANANIIRRTLANFGIEVEMDEVTIGPTVTRYALKPAEGMKLSRIVGLQNDLALALAAHPLRIEAPIPGKSLVGIEIPNKTKATVGLASLLSDQNFSQNPKPLLCAIGRNISGKPVIKSIASMPHLLIAGTTGSGKSVTIHAIITSLLYHHGPDDLRFIFVDPKRVELPLYNGIPHLLTPVITDPKKTILALKWAATEMNRRYDILEAESTRDISSYHKKLESGKVRSASDEEPDRMPYIVIIIDELADIMQAYPRELESAIVRLAQMSRAVGIHLILSTQRPEVNVITGLIKANIPARVALRVPTQIDSRTILDAAGAEKLLGAGDMLAIIGDNQAERLQSAFITEEEVKSVVKYLKDEFKGDERDTIELAGSISSEKAMFGDDLDGDDDELYEEARQIVIEAGKASTSYIQRKLKVGYARAARLMDMLEERGVIGGADGAKPREVLVEGIKNPTSDEVANDLDHLQNND